MLKTSHQINHPNRNFGLDLFRAIAIVLVVLSHGKFMLNDTALEDFPYLSNIDGVDVFFVLSGFLIGGILLKTLQSPEKKDTKNLFHFWKRRWFRTLPNYYLILGVNYFLVKYGWIEGNIDRFNAHFLTFTHNFAQPFMGFFWESWSLSVEEWFYLLSPIFLWLLARIFPVKTNFIVVAGLMILVPTLYRMHLYHPNLDGFWWDVSIRKTVMTRLDGIGYGLVLAWVYAYFPKFWNTYKWWFAGLGALLLVWIVNSQFPSHHYYKQTFYFTVLPICIMCFLPLFHAWKSANGLGAKTVQYISKISYSMYLVNLALIAMPIAKHFPPQGGMDGLVKYLIYWILVIVLSSILFYAYERPMMNLRDKNLFFKTEKSKPQIE